MKKLKFLCANLGIGGDTLDFDAMIFIYKNITEYINSDIIKGKLLPGQFSTGDSFFFESKNLLHVALLIIEISRLRH